jgi:hypothetical protein
MMLKQIFRGAGLIMVLAAAPFLAGSQCAFFFNSGGDSDDEDKEEQTVVIASGIFGAAPVAGANYASGSVNGVTGSHGEFQYEIDEPVQFSIGDIQLGRAVDGKSVITPQDLVADGAADTTAAINIQRLLLSLDAQPGDDIITIPAGVRAGAVQSNEMLSAAMTGLDFNNDTAFANAASQLVAVLTSDYPFTGVLIDAQTARATMLETQNTRRISHE